jgi:hypothetical protein
MMKNKSRINGDGNVVIQGSSNVHSGDENVVTQGSSNVHSRDGNVVTQGSSNTNVNKHTCTVISIIIALLAVIVAAIVGWDNIIKFLK